MKSKLTIHAIRQVPCAVAIALVLAGTMPQTNVLGGAPQAPERGDPGGPPLEVEVESSYTFGGDAEFRGAKFGDSDAFNASLSLRGFWQLNEQWSVPLELQSQHLSLSSLAGVPLPDNINTLEFGIGLGYRPNDRWMFMARISPVLFKFDDIGGNDIGLSGGLMAEWQYSPSLKWMFGVMWQPNNALPVIPMVGLDWLINSQWELQLMFPKPRLIYSLNDKLKLHAGMDLVLGTTFRATDTLGTSIGLPKYNDALGSYSDIRLAFGVGYQVSKSLGVEAEGGYSVSRSIEYTDLDDDDEVTLDPAPYFRIGLRFEF